MLSRLTLLLILKIFTAAWSLLTDNDSDDDVNGGSPKPPNRQHRKDKKEFPVSQSHSHCVWNPQYLNSWFCALLLTFRNQLSTVCLPLLKSWWVLRSFLGSSDVRILASQRLSEKDSAELLFLIPDGSLLLQSVWRVSAEDQLCHIMDPSGHQR